LNELAARLQELKIFPDAKLFAIANWRAAVRELSRYCSKMDCPPQIFAGNS